MFNFDFEIDEAVEGISGLDFSKTIKPAQVPEAAVEEPFTPISLEHLIECLPPLLSCSPLSIPLSNGTQLSISRRDLFDARFQLINEEDDGRDTGKDAVDFLDAPSDLVHGIYEGGLKTWECSLDLVDYLDSNNALELAGKRILEAGCGTAVPSLYFLQKIFSAPPQAHPIHIHLQDYNKSVLELITFPNVVVAWYMSDASKTYRENASVLLDDPDTELPSADASSEADIPISPELKAAFLASLSEYAITLEFFSGSWRTFRCDAPYNIVLTSETIYRAESVPSLISLLQSSVTPNSTCLVAAKVFYFGVGGGISAFVKAIEESSGRSETVWERSTGVGRKILKLRW